MTGGTDSTGSAQYNYDLSQRRADAVVQYLAAKYNVPAHRFYLIGIGKDQEVAPNNDGGRPQAEPPRADPVAVEHGQADQQQAPATAAPAGTGQ